MAIEQVADTPVLRGRRTTLRPLEVEDFSAWREVRRRNAELLNRWEPRRTFGQPDPVEDRRAFAMRCAARRRERQLGTGTLIQSKGASAPGPSPSGGGCARPGGCGCH